MLDQLLVITGVTVLVLISPGPDMIIVLRNTLLEGRAGGLQTALGVLTGNLVHISYCVIGIGWLISQSIVAFNVLKLAGAAYLVWLGIRSLRAGRTRLDPAAHPRAARNRTCFWQGFINNLLNPKGTMFYLGVFTLVITPDTSAFRMLVLITVMMLICALFWLLFIATIDRPAVRRGIERWQGAVQNVFGVLLISLGLRVAFLQR